MYIHTRMYMHMHMYMHLYVYIYMHMYVFKSCLRICLFVCLSIHLFLNSVSLGSSAIVKVSEQPNPYCPKFPSKFRKNKVPGTVAKVGSQEQVPNKNPKKLPGNRFACRGFPGRHARYPQRVGQGQIKTAFRHTFKCPLRRRGSHFVSQRLAP